MLRILSVRIKGHNSQLSKCTVRTLALAFATAVAAQVSGCGSPLAQRLHKTTSTNFLHKDKSDQKKHVQRIYLNIDSALNARHGIDAAGWFRSPFLDKHKTRVTDTEKFVQRVLRLKQLDPTLYHALREKALLKAAALSGQREPADSESFPYALFLRLIFEDHETWISYVREKSGISHVEEGTDPHLQGTPDRRFQDALAPVLVQLDKTIVNALLPQFFKVYPNAGKRYLLRNPAPDGKQWKSDGQGPKRIIDSFVRYTTLPEYDFMSRFLEARKSLDPELAAGIAYEAYLKDIRQISGFPAQPLIQRGTEVGTTQAAYDTTVLAEILFEIQKHLRKDNENREMASRAILIFGGSLPRGTATLGELQMGESLTPQPNGRTETTTRRQGSDIDTLIKLTNGQYLGVTDKNRGLQLANILTEGIRSHLNQTYSSRVIFNLEVNDDKLSRHRFVQKLTEFDLSKINPVLLEIGQDHICLIIHNFSNRTTSNLEILRPGVMVFPIQSHFQKVSGRKITPNESPCVSQRRAPWRQHD